MLRGLAHIVVGDDDADTAPLQLLDDRLDVGHVQGVYAGKTVSSSRMKAGVHRQRAGDLDPPAFSARQRKSVAVADFGNGEFLEKKFPGVSSRSAFDRGQLLKHTQGRFSSTVRRRNTEGS